MSPRAAAAVVRRCEHVMGMPVSLAIRGRHADSPVGRGAWRAVMHSLRRADAVFSTYRDDSYVMRLDRGEIGLDVCPPEVAEVLALGAQAERDSGGAFRVRRPGPDGALHLDPSGVVKGWAVERAAVMLDALPDTDFCLSAGGDMVCRSNGASDRGWRVGIEDPHDPRRVLATVRVRDGAVATSGTAHRGAHLVDGRTGRTPHGVASVTVVGGSLTAVDIDATAAYARGADALRWLNGRDGRTGLVVWADGTTTVFGTPDAA